MGLCPADVTGGRKSGGMKSGKAKRLFEETEITTVPSMGRGADVVMRSQRHQDTVPDPAPEPREGGCFQMNWVVWQLAGPPWEEGRAERGRAKGVPAWVPGTEHL